MKTTQRALEVPARKIGNQTSEEQYKYVLAVAETAQVSLFKNMDHHIYVSIVLNLSRIQLVVCLLDIAADKKLIGADSLHPSFLDNIYELNRPNTRSASITNWSPSGTINVLQRESKSHTFIELNVVSKLVAPILLQTTYIGKSIN